MSLAGEAVRASPGSRSVTVLLNPAAGIVAERQDAPAYLNGLFAEAGLAASIVIVESPSHAESAVRSAVAAGSDTIVAAGGDGTVNRVASALLETNTPLGVLPLGTLNHFAKDLGIPLDLEKAVRTIADRHIRRVDVGDVNGRTFVNNSSIGIYPDIVVEREALRAMGYRKWAAFAIATTKVLNSCRSLVVRIATGEQMTAVQTPFLLVGNNEYIMEGLRMGGRARLDAGLLFVYFSPRLGARDLPKVVAQALVGRAERNATLESFSATLLTVDTPGRRRLRVAFDGEVTIMPTPLKYRVRPASLDVIVPAPLDPA